MEQPAKSFRDLLVWQKAHEFALAVYRLVESLPAAERHGLASPLRQAAGGIGANIVAGYHRRAVADKRRSYHAAQAAADESLYLLILVQDLEVAGTRGLQGEAEEVGRLLHGYLKGLQRQE